MYSLAGLEGSNNRRDTFGCNLRDIHVKCVLYPSQNWSLRTVRFDLFKITLYQGWAGFCQKLKLFEISSFRKRIQNYDYRLTTGSLKGPCK